MPRQSLPLQFRNALASPVGSITMAAFALRQKVALEQPRIFAQYALVYLLDGRGFYEDANGWRQKLVPGDMILVFPDLEHFYNPEPGRTWAVSFLCFAGPVFDLWREMDILNPRWPVYHREPVDEWSRRLGALLGPRRQIGSDTALGETCRLLSFLAAVVQGEGDVPLMEDDRRWAQRACGLIEASLDGDLDWASMARQFGLSTEGFRKRFARLTGHPPARYRMGRLIDRACEMMCGTRLTDRQIAERLGFCDEFYFSRRFKEITGRPPRAFRRSLALPAGTASA